MLNNCARTIAAIMAYNQSTLELRSAHHAQTRPQFPGRRAGPSSAPSVTILPE
jgi:hypothetical protein